MASGSAWATQENWRQRIVKEERSVVSRSKQQGEQAAYPCLVVQSGPSRISTIGTPTLLKPPQPWRPHLPHSGGSQTRGVQCSLEDAVGQPPIPTARSQQSKRSITGSVNGYAGSAVCYRHSSNRLEPHTPQIGSRQSSRAASEAGTRQSHASAWSYATSAPPFKTLNIPSREGPPRTPASQCSYPSTPNFSSAGTANTEEVVQKLEQLERELEFERQRRTMAEKEMQRLRMQSGRR